MPPEYRGGACSHSEKRGVEVWLSRLEKASGRAFSKRVGVLPANNVLQKTKTAVGNFSILLPHSGFGGSSGLVARRQAAVLASEHRR
jgi:hypothetical protein